MSQLDRIKAFGGVTWKTEAADCELHTFEINKKLQISERNVADFRVGQFKCLDHRFATGYDPKHDRMAVYAEHFGTPVVKAAPFSKPKDFKQDETAEVRVKTIHSEGFETSTILDITLSQSGNNFMPWQSVAVAPEHNAPEPIADYTPRRSFSALGQWRRGESTS